MLLPLGLILIFESVVTTKMMNFPNTNGKLDLKNRDDQILIPKNWSPQYPMYDGDATPATPGTYYANLKTPDGSMFKRYYQ